MTKQLFSDLNDLAAEQVAGGASTFYTAKVEWTPSSLDDVTVDAGELSFNGEFNTLKGNTKKTGWSPNAKGATGTSYVEGANNVFAASTAIDSVDDSFIYVVDGQQFAYDGTTKAFSLVSP